MIDQRHDIYRLHVLDVIEHHIQVLPAAAQADFREHATGDSGQRQQAQRLYQLFEQPATFHRGCRRVHLCQQFRDLAVGRRFTGLHAPRTLDAFANAELVIFNHADSFAVKKTRRGASGGSPAVGARRIPVVAIATPVVTVAHVDGAPFQLVCRRIARRPVV
ncbi:hypothetical protein D3C85_1448330 [compost metagenome]